MDKFNKQIIFEQVTYMHCGQMLQLPGVFIALWVEVYLGHEEGLIGVRQKFRERCLIGRQVVLRWNRVTGSWRAIHQALFTGA